MNGVTTNFTKSEGAGDFSYDYFYSEHVSFFT